MTKKKDKPNPDIAAAWKEYEKVLAAARIQMRYGKDSAHASNADYLRLGAALKAALGREEKLHEERESWARHSRRQRDLAVRYRKGLERVLRAIGDEGAAPDELNVSLGPEELCRLVPEMVERLVARERADAPGADRGAAQGRDRRAGGSHAEGVPRDARGGARRARLTWTCRSCY